MVDLLGKLYYWKDKEKYKLLFYFEILWVKYLNKKKNSVPENKIIRLHKYIKKFLRILYLQRHYVGPKCRQENYWKEIMIYCQ